MTTEMVTHHDETDIGEHETPNAFRLKNITLMQEDIEQQLEKYTECKGKYKKVFSALSYITTGAATLSTVAGGTSMALLTTGIGAPASIVLGSLSIAAGACSFITSAFSKKIMRKLEKHDAIVALTVLKLSSFRLIISKALTDSIISEEEFHLLLDDYDDYKRQKFAIQNKHRSSSSTVADDYTKKGYLLGLDKVLKK